MLGLSALATGLVLADRGWGRAGCVPWSERSGGLRGGEVAEGRIRVRAYHTGASPSCTRRTWTVLPSGRARRVLRGLPPAEGAAGPVWSPSGELLTFQQGVARDHRGRRPGVAAIAAAHQRRRRSHLVARRTASGVTGSICSAATGLFGWSRRNGLRRVIAREARGRRGRPRAGSRSSTTTTRAADPSGLKDGTYAIRPDGSRLQRLFGRYWAPANSRLVARWEQSNT